MSHNFLCWPAVKTPSPRIGLFRVFVSGYTFQPFQLLIIKNALDELVRPLPASAPIPKYTSDPIKVNGKQDKYTKYAGSINTDQSKRDLSSN